MAARYLVPILATASAVLAKTDLEGCTSFTSTVTVNPSPGYGNTYQTVIYYVPDTLEICRGVDCGGGRAPPRKVPGCPNYSGTDTVTASFLPTDPAKQAADTVTVTPTRTSTIVKVVTTPTSTSGTPNPSDSARVTETPTHVGDSASTGVASLSGQASSAITVGTQSDNASGSGAAATTTATPAGAGPTARAGVVAALGVAAAVALI